MQTTIQKRPICQVLRGMKVGDVETFPMSQYHSVRNSQYYQLREERLLGWRFKQNDIPGNPHEFTITRLS